MLTISSRQGNADLKHKMSETRLPEWLSSERKQIESLGEDVEIKGSCW